MAAAVVHKEEEIIIRINDSVSVLDAEITAIQVALDNASELDKIHTTVNFQRTNNDKRTDDTALQ